MISFCSNRRFHIMVWGMTLSMIVFQLFLVGSSLYHDYRDTVENEKRFFGDIARVADENISGMLRAVELLLSDVAAEIERHGYADQKYIQEYMRVRAQSFPNLHTVFSANSRGIIDIAPRPEALGVDINDRPYYFELKNDAGRKNVPHYSLLRSKIDNSYRLFIAHALQDPAGEWRGIVGVTIDLKTLHDLLASLAPDGRSSAVNLVNKDGLIVARSQDAEKQIGVSVDYEDSHFRSHLNSGERVTFKRLRYITDGMERISCARTLGNGQFVIFVSKSVDEILENWRVKAAYRIIGVLASVFMLLFLARMVSDRHRAAVEATLAVEKANEQLLRLSTTDGLTGLANRRHFDQVLEAEWRRAVRQSQSLALIMVDADYFKKYNDHYGHQNGDDCLRRIASVLLIHTQRAGELAARYGGEEFAVILPDTSLAQALAWAEDMRQAVVKLALPHAATDLGIVSLSLGVAGAIPGDFDGDVSSLIAAADRALYRAKEKGRNRVESA